MKAGRPQEQILRAATSKAKKTYLPIGSGRIVQEMELELGVVCGKCSRYHPLQSRACDCGHVLALEAPSIPHAPPNPPVTADAPVVASPQAALEVEDEPPPSSLFQQPLKRRALASQPKLAAALPQPDHSAQKNSEVRKEEITMEQAKNFVCRSCATPVPVGHKFCGRCGAGVPPEIIAARTQFFNPLQTPGKAKLIVIRGEGIEGLSFQLGGESHIVGRHEGDVDLAFPDDRFISPKHANFVYRNDKLVLEDQNSLNGIYIRVNGTVELPEGSMLMVGEQVFRLDGPNAPEQMEMPDGTMVYVSPTHPMRFRLTQILEGGTPGMSVCSRLGELQIGREGGDLNFPSDLFMSGSHCKIIENNGKLSLVDLGSRNGTYIRIIGDRELVHGDYVFLGRKLLRVEITS